MANKTLTIQYVIKARDKFSAATNKAADSVKRLRSETKLSATRFRENAAKMRKAGLAMSAGITAPVALLAKNLADLAMEAGETQSKFNTLFDGFEGRANKASNALAKNYLLSQNSARELIGNTGAILQSAGTGAEEAFKMSVNLQQMAADFGSFHNIDTVRVSQAMTSALLGERESLKGMGLVITEAEVKSVKLQLAQKGLTYATDQQAKMAATLAIIQQKQGKAQGDVARTADQAANKQRKFAARLDDLKLKIGRIILPLMVKLVAVADKMVTAFDKLSPGAQKFIVVAVGLAAVVGPLLILVGLMVPGLLAVASAFKFIGVALGLTNPVFLVFLKTGLAMAAPFIAVIALLGFAAYKVYEARDSFVWFYHHIKEGMAGVADYIGERVAVILGHFTNLKNKGIALLNKLPGVDINTGDGAGAGNQGAQVGQAARGQLDVNVGLAPGLEQQGAIKQTGAPGGFNMGYSVGAM